MAKKENKGGILTNQQIEQDLKAKGASVPKGGYKGTQDTGADIVPEQGNEVQKTGGADKENSKGR